MNNLRREATTKYIIDFFAENANKYPAIIEAFSDGLFTIEEAAKGIIEAYHNETAARVALENVGYKSDFVTIESAARYFSNTYGAKAPEAIAEIYNK